MGEDPIDARETELGPSSGGLELFVRCVNDRTCFVALPRSVADAVARRNPRVGGCVWLPGRIAEACGEIGREPVSYTHLTLPTKA